LPDESEKQASPIAEVQIEGLARDAGALGQLLQAKAGTALNQYLSSHLEEALAGLGVAVPARGIT
jgi:hypothetical protein